MILDSLNIVIIGGGIAGLSSAIALRRSGHQVRVLERSSYAQEVGAAITVPPNASRILKRWTMDFDKAHMNPYAGMYLLKADGTTLDRWRHSDFSHMEDSFGSPYLLSHRVDLHDSLRELASGTGEGLPAEIINNSRVVSFDKSNGTVHFYDGRSEKSLQADLIIVADGVHSQGCEILGFNSPVIPSSTTVIRFLIATQDLLSDPVTASLLQYGDNQGSMYVSSDKNRWLFRYPCRKNTLQNFSLYSTDPNNEAVVQGTRRADCNRSDLLYAMRGFHPSLLAICNKTAEILPLWICMERAPLPKYTQQKLLLVGDAAHAMLPHIGQGAAQAIEDAAALEVLFSQVYSGPTIAERLCLFDRVRRDRATAAQILSHVMVWDQGDGEVEQWFLDSVPTIRLPGKGIKQARNLILLILDIGTKPKRHSFLYGHDITNECETLMLNYIDSNKG